MKLFFSPGIPGCFVGGEGGTRAGVVQAACGHKRKFADGSRWTTPGAT
jgi:hypothetical protein